MKPPQVSVLMTSYNYGRYVERAIRSALEQLDDLEVVVIDDASTDDSWDVVSRLCASDDRIRPFRNERNQGIAANVRRLPELARSEWLQFLAADDYLLPGHLRCLMNAHREHPEVDVVYAPYFRVDENERVIDRIGHIGHLRGSYIGGRNEFAELLTYDSYATIPTTLFRREELLATPLASPDFVAAADYDLYLRLARQGKTFAFLDVPGLCFRVHGEAISHPSNYVATGKQVEEHVQILERHLTEETWHLVSGHERAIARLLQAKINNLHAYPEAAQRVLPPLTQRIEAIGECLNRFMTRTQGQPVPQHPHISVVLPCGDDLNAAVATLQSMKTQTYDRFEVVIVADASFASMPFLRDAARGIEFKTLSHTTPQPLAVALNDAVRLAGGDLIAYAQPGNAWPPTHLEQLADRFSNQNVEALLAPVGISSGNLSLWSLVHVRRLFDRIGGFYEHLGERAVADFLSRLAPAS